MLLQKLFHHAVEKIQHEEDKGPFIDDGEQRMATCKTFAERPTGVQGCSLHVDYEIHVEIRRTYNPGLMRPLVPLAKKVLGGKGGDPSAILESKPYRLYLKTAYPIERSIARLWPGMLAFQMIFEARPQ